jgi:hypothetical protein
MDFCLNARSFVRHGKPESAKIVRLEILVHRGWEVSLVVSASQPHRVDSVFDLRFGQNDNSPRIAVDFAVSSMGQALFSGHQSRVAPDRSITVLRSK